MSRRGNSNYTLTVWGRWLKQTGGRPLYYLTLHLFWSPYQPPPTDFISGSISIKKLSLFSSVSNYLHLCYRLIFALKPGEIIFKVPPLWSHNLIHTIFCYCVGPVNYTKSLSLESSMCQLHLGLTFWYFYEAMLSHPWFLFGCQTFSTPFPG